ncbi:LppP/LprE family lipoprotein [Pseudomonas entomophila]|uniref:LppP/LprE family lipoprotein n=1 Tax=Pseudomonas entomophila TaxID=312306 RepID=UPI00200EDDC9|nr:LppP/LprE family lipoprotein [Pseudomonas entomophila]
MISNSIRWGLALGGVLALAGCDAMTDYKLSMARQALREECFGNFTNSCVSKTIDYNIQVLEAVPLAGPKDKEGLIAMFGDKGWALYQEAEEEVKDEVIEVLEKKRPGIFSRWVLGDAQPFDGKGVIEFAPSDLQEIKAQVERIYIAKVKAAGLQPDKAAAAKYGEAQSQASTPVAPEPAASPVVAAEPVNTPAVAGNRAFVTLDAAMQALIAQETASDGGSEYPEARQQVQLDLNGDGVEDAVVLYTIEGQGGGNSAYQALAAYYHGSDGWQLQQTLVVGGATQLQRAGPETITVKVLSHADDDPRCCPSLETEVKYRWTGSTFAEQPAPSQNAG